MCSGAPELKPAFLLGSCYLIFSFMCNVLQIVVCPFLLVFVVIVLSVLLRCTDFDYPFGICILFLNPNFLNLAYDKLFYFRFIYVFDINENEVCLIKLSTIYRCSMFTVKTKTKLFRFELYLREKCDQGCSGFF